MGNTTTASVTGAQVAPAKSAIKDLPIAKVWAFAVGQFGWALLSGIISNWLVYFYQPDQEAISQGQTVFVPQGLVVLGIVTVVGGITAFARFFDAFVDPAVASLSDRCDAKSGRRMPFLKFAALPLAVVTVLVFWSPINGTSWVNAAFLFVTVIGYYIALTFYCTPYNALIAELGHDSKQQLTISTAISFTWVAGTAIAYVAPVIWGAFVPMMGRITAIRVTFTIMAAVAFVCMLVPPLAIREKDYVNSQPTSESTIESLKQTFGDGEFRKFVCSDVVYWVAITTFQTGLPFFVTSLLKLPETTTTIYFVLMTGASSEDIRLNGTLTVEAYQTRAKAIEAQKPAKRVSASTNPEDAENVLDEKINTVWQGNKGDYITFALKNGAKVDKVAIAFTRDNNLPATFEIQLSGGGGQFLTVYSSTVSEYGKLISYPFKGTTASDLRIVLNDDRVSIAKVKF